MKYLVIPLLLLLAACSPTTDSMVAAKPLPEMTPAPVPHFDPVQKQQYNWIAMDGGQSQLDFNPQVDILFIIDNSDSMRDHEDNLVKNLDRFSDGIIKNKMIDYHIGVASCWDSTERYAKTKKDPYQVGELRYVRDSKGQNYSQRFITRKEDKSLLAPTLNIGVASYADGGPEIEEFFSPMAAAIDKSGHGGVNDGFFRPDAQLVVIFMTDADDSTSSMSPEQAAQKLFDFKGGDKSKIAVYGVLVKATDPDDMKDWDLRIHPKYHPECFDMTKKVPKNNGQCKGFGPERMEQFIMAANADAGTPTDVRAEFIKSIVSKNYGADLSEIGSDIAIKTLAKEIFLQERPLVQNNQIQVSVRYGTPAQLAQGKGQVIQQSQKGGWLYNPDHNSVVLSGDINYQYQDGSRFAVSYIPVTIAQ